MVTAVQVQSRRDTATNIAAFTGALGEIVVDTTNNRAVVNDGTTAGGWPAAKLAETQTIGRTTVADAAKTVAATDSTIAYTSLTASRTVTLCAASAYAAGRRLIILDESGACSFTNILTITAAGSDTINGLASVLLARPYGALMLESNGSNKWTVIGQSRILLNILTASSSASLSDTTSFGAAFPFYDVELINLVPATSGVTPQFQVNVGGTVETSSYYYVLEYNAGASASVTASTSASFIQLSSTNAVANSSPGLSGLLSVDNPEGSTMPKMWRGTMAMLATGTALESALVAGYWNGGNTALKGFVFSFSSGNIANGQIAVYGRG